MSETLTPLREEIDALDREIIALLAKRMEIVHCVAAIKQAENIPVRIPERIQEVLDHAASLAEERHFDPNVARQIYDILIEYACRTEEGLIAKSSQGAAE